jgi:inhibitor of KinA sporulation pathway (predicted exonuclease)
LEQNLILFDLEYTAWPGSQARRWSEPWEHREIIQISAAQVAVNAAVTETACFDSLVKPARNPLLSPYISGLTGIEQAAVDQEGVSFPRAFAGFYAFCCQGQLPLFCWGDDPAVLFENFSLNDLARPPFPAGIYDLRPLFEQAGIDTRQYTSGTVYQAVGAAFDQAAHNALNDVRSLATTIRHLQLAGRIETDWVASAKAMGRFPHVNYS